MTVPKIGAYVLESLTTGMYKEPLDTLRELVQNSIDAIDRAGDEDLIPVERGRVEIEINPVKALMRVRDNGVGVPEQEFEPRLLNIGMSDKVIGQNAGFRGIGRLPGIAYCRRLTFSATATGEKKASTISFDCDAIRKAVVPARRQAEELGTVLMRNCTVSSSSAKPADHYFEVVLEGVTEQSLLDQNAVNAYLSLCAPVPFDHQRFPFAHEIEKFARTHSLRLPSYTVVLRTPPHEFQVFKPYKTTYKTRKTNGGGYDMEVADVGFFPEKPDPAAGYWLWYSRSNLPGVLNDAAAGIRLRKSNIALGGAENVADLFAKTADSNRRFNGYFIGELHVTCHDAIPNARRDNIEDGQAWERIKAELMSFIRERCVDIREASKKGSLTTIQKETQRVVEDARHRADVGFVSESEIDDLLDKVKQQKEKLAEASGGRSSKFGSKLKSVRKELTEVERRLAQSSSRTEVRLTEREQQIVEDVITILKRTLPKVEFEKARRAVLAKYPV